jgi:hypothetical protein
MTMTQEQAEKMVEAYAQWVYSRKKSTERDEARAALIAALTAPAVITRDVTTAAHVVNLEYAQIFEEGRLRGRAESIAERSVMADAVAAIYNDPDHFPDAGKMVAEHDPTNPFAPRYKSRGQGGAT